MGTQTTTAKPPAVRTFGAGAVAGMVAGAAMGMYAMVAAATYQGSGFFTPLYHIASTFIEPSAMETSMQRAMEGDLYYFSAGPALVGLAVHMMVAIVFGLVFASIVRRTGLHSGLAPIVGVVYGLTVFALMSAIILPVVADIFGAGKPISDMAQMVGYGTFAVEHALFGLVLGLWPLTRPQDIARGRVRVGRESMA
jgi:uncharacterized membrane protein YagU involved in acid resistance